MFKEQYEKLVAKYGKQKVMIVAVIVGLVVLGLIGRGASRNAGEEAAERIIENMTGGQVDIDADGDEVTVKTDQGTYTTADKLPADFPSDVPVYAGAKVVGSVTADGAQGGMYVGLETTAAVDDVIAWYRSEVKARGWTVQTDATVSGSLILSATKDTRVLSVGIAQDDGTVSITLTVASQ